MLTISNFRRVKSENLAFLMREVNSKLFTKKIREEDSVSI